MSPSTDSRENREFAAEIKFLVHPALAPQIRSWARSRLGADPHADGDDGDTYRITSLYFDTDRLDVLNRQGSFGRCKYRIRQYGLAGDHAFLERKLKTKGLLAKRRSVVGMSDLGRLCTPDPQGGWSGFWFHRRILARRLGPVCQITYDRMARVAMGPNGPIRLTLDNNLRAVPAVGLWFNDTPGRLILEDRLVLELKFRRRVPALFKQLVEEFALTPQPFSKYRTAMAALGLGPVTDIEPRAILASQHA
jgi:hypothetical protein